MTSIAFENKINFVGNFFYKIVICFLIKMNENNQ